MLKPGFELHISSISTLTRQTLCAAMDKQDPMGRDWCLLAVKMGLMEKVPKLEPSSAAAHQRDASQMAKLLDEWEMEASSTIGNRLCLFYAYAYMQIRGKLCFIWWSRLPVKDIAVCVCVLWIAEDHENDHSLMPVCI